MSTSIENVKAMRQSQAGFIPGFVDKICDRRLGVYFNVTVSPGIQQMLFMFAQLVDREHLIIQIKTDIFFHCMTTGGFIDAFLQRVQ